MSESSRSAIQHSLKFLCSFWGTIGQSALCLGPYKFYRIEFRGISREPFQMEPWITIQEVTNGFSPMDESRVPQEDDLTPKMSQEMAHKGRHIKGIDIFPLKSEVEPQASPLGRDGETGDGRDPVSPVKMMQDGSLSPRRPCPTYIGDEKKPTFIEKGQMGSKCDGFFLLPANASFSNVLSPPRLFPEPAVPASDNSTLTPSEVAKDDWDDNESQKTCESPRPPGAWSKDRCCNQNPPRPSAKDSPIASSPVPKAWKDDPERPCNSALSLLPFERSAAIEKRNLLRSLPVLPPPTRSCPSPATGSLVGAASPVASGFLEVS